ncbi:MAG: cell division protein FtsQ/DivIB [Cellulosilyticaceae bacterium]
MKKWTYAIGLIILGLITIFILPIWQVDQIIIKGNEVYTEEEIRTAMTLSEGMHITQLNKEKVVDEISIFPYMGTVDVAYKFPNDVIINIHERRPLGYVRFLDTYIAIDEDGFAVEQSSTRRMKLPIIEGLQFNQVTIGGQIQIENTAQMQTLKEITRILRKYEFFETVDVIEVANIEQMHLYVDKLNVIIGDIRDFDKKVRYLIEVHKQYAMGILDLSLIDTKQAILKPLS